MRLRVCAALGIRAVVLLALVYKGIDRHSLALLLIDDVVIDRRWVRDRTPDGESKR